MKKIFIILALVGASLIGSKATVASPKDTYFSVTKVAETPRTWDDNGSYLYRVKVGDDTYMIVRMRGGLVVLPK